MTIENRCKRILVHNVFPSISPNFFIISKSISKPTKDNVWIEIRTDDDEIKYLRLVLPHLLR